MPTRAIVPSTQMSTSTTGATATNASTGCRNVTQKKIARMPTATAIVVLMAAVWPAVISSWTATPTMSREVAVTLTSSPNQSASSSSWSALVAAALPE